MNTVSLWTSIRARALADTGTGGLFNAGTPLVTGIYNTIAPPGLEASYPYIIFNVANMEQRDAFNSDIIEATVRFTVINTIEQTGSTSGMAECAAIIDRLYGDAMASGTRTPSYGFHRWTMGASGNWIGGIMHRINQFQNHDVDHYEFTEEYRLILSRASA